MSNLSERVYSILECPHSVSSLFKTLGTLGTGIEWVIEAGCHNESGSKDTIGDEYHGSSNFRKANFTRVIKILQKQGFCVLNCDINPGYFGDILFIRKSPIPIKRRFISNLNRLLLISLHSYVYPSLKKPLNWKLGTI